MRFLLLNQTFHPDVASTAQHLSDLALHLVERGHRVTVLTSRRAYDDPRRLFPKTELWRGIRIHRIFSTSFGKGARWRRVLDFGSFLFLCTLRLLVLPGADVVVALTSPPLISFLGAWISKLRGSRFFYWVMDLNPDEAIAAGWLRQNSFPARILEYMSRFSLRRATMIIALDRFMRDRILAKGIESDKIIVLPPWSHETGVKFDPVARDTFRRKHGLETRFVVMYSGNHSPCHPLDTLLEAADRLSDDPGIAFCFVGGGSEFRKIQARTRDQRSEVRGHKSYSQLPSPNPQLPISPKHRNTEAPPPVLCLPYQPLNSLSGSLSAADLHVVVMGNPFVGLVHPCKIYNILSVAAPVLYIGPRRSHLSELLDSLKPFYPFANASHGDVEAVIQFIKRIRDEFHRPSRQVPVDVFSRFTSQTLVPQFIRILEASCDERLPVAISARSPH